MRTPFLLKGILFDTQGHRFSPVQGRKGPRAYRYYVNQVVLQFGEMPPRQIRRMPAEPLEQAVMNAVMEALKEEEDAQVWISHVKELNALDTHMVWQQLLTRVEVTADRLRITLNPTGVMDQDWVKPAQDANGERKEVHVRTLEVPWVMTWRGGRTELMLEGVPVRTNPQPQAGLVAAVVRALQWKDELLEGRVPTIQALAQREGLTRRYVMRVLRLSFLAPDLIEAILMGQHPPAFTLEPFRCPIPLDWAVQRKYFGFIPS